METNKEIPTAEGYLSNITGQNGIYLTHGSVYGSDAIEAMIEFAKLHLSKQAEVIAEKARAYSFHNKETGFDIAIVDKQTILQASEEYIKSINL